MRTAPGKAPEYADENADGGDDDEGDEGDEDDAEEEMEGKSEVAYRLSSQGRYRWKGQNQSHSLSFVRRRCNCKKMRDYFHLRRVFSDDNNRDHYP